MKKNIIKNLLLILITIFLWISTQNRLLIFVMLLFYICTKIVEKNSNDKRQRANKRLYAEELCYLTKEELEKEKEKLSVSPRIITLNLSDEDCKRLHLEAGKANLQVSELVEKFIADFVYGSFCTDMTQFLTLSQWFEESCLPNEKSFFMYLTYNYKYLDEYLEKNHNTEYLKNIWILYRDWLNKNYYFSKEYISFEEELARIKKWETDKTLKTKN